MFKILILTFLFSINAFAHEDHEHGPSQVQAPKGGVIRSLETVHLELLTKGPAITIYLYDMNLKPADVSKYPVSATVALPKKKAQPLTLRQKGDHWEAEFDAKGSHRYALEIFIKQGGHDDEVKFNVEPKK